MLLQTRYSLNTKRIQVDMLEENLLVTEGSEVPLHYILQSVRRAEK